MRYFTLLLLGLYFSLDAAAAVSVRDDLGNVVALPQPARRIVSLAPHVTELLYAAGAGARVVGAVDYSDYPPAAKVLPRVGAYNALDLEAILALRPDLVVAWQSGNPPAVLQKLRELGLALFVSEPRELADVASNLQRLGELAGTPAPAARAAQAFMARLQDLRRHYQSRPTVTVFYPIWSRPLMTVNGEHLISKVIRLCGGRNVFAALPALVPKLDVEAVLAADPQVIVSGQGPQDPAWRDTWRRWPQLQAVRNDLLFDIDPDLMHRHTPRILQGAALLCEDLERARVRHQPSTSR
jgi:iron complex transport system substrate-binding protein